MYHVIVWHLLQPYPIILLLLASGIALLWWKRRETWRRLLLVTSAFFLLVVVSLPDVGYLLQGSLEWQYPPVEQRPADVEAIVVLAGYLCPPVASGGRTELGEDSLDRCIWAAELYHQGKPCPVLVTGGNSDPERTGQAVADAMGELLLRLGIPKTDLLVENRSRSTDENALESHRLLEEHGLHKVLLVTDAAHLQRAVASFRKAGTDVIPCGCQYRAVPPSGVVERLVPSADALGGCQVACHEWLGLAWYWLRGKI